MTSRLTKTMFIVIMAVLFAVIAFSVVSLALRADGVAYAAEESSSDCSGWGCSWGRSVSSSGPVCEETVSRTAAVSPAGISPFSSKVSVPKAGIQIPCRVSTAPRAKAIHRLPT